MLFGKCFQNVSFTQDEDQQIALANVHRGTYPASNKEQHTAASLNLSMGSIRTVLHAVNEPAADRSGITAVSIVCIHVGLCDLSLICDLLMMIVMQVFGTGLMV